MISTICGNSVAQIIADRPDHTESSSTVPKGALQSESGILVSYEGDNHISTRQILLPTTLFRYGITEGVEFRIMNQFESVKSADQNCQGISDLDIGAKIQIIKNRNRNTEIAFLTHLVVPTGSRELTIGEIASLSKISVSHRLSENAGIGYNLGYNFSGNGRGDLTYSLALGIGINEKAGVYLEPYGEITNMDKFILNLGTGFTYLVKTNLQLDFSFGTGVSQRSNFISMGCSWLIERE